MAKQILLYPFKNYILKKGLQPDVLMQWMEYTSASIVKWELDVVAGPPDGAFTDLLGETASGGSITGSVANTANGICRVTTGGTINNYCYVFPNGGESMKGAFALGNNSTVMWAKVKIDAITTVKIELGLTDSDADAGAVNVLATPLTTASDCALWCFDTDDSGAPYWQGVHSVNSTTPSKVEPAKFAPVAAAYEWLGIALLGGAVKFMRCDAYGNPMYESAWQSSGITADDPLIPWIGAHTRTGTARNLDIERWVVYQRLTSDDD